MLWLAVHLPMFALEVNQAGQRVQAPAVLIDGNRVVLGNRAARQAGIGLQGTLATAHGICPGLVHYRRDPGRERKRLRLLAGMCYRFTSRVSLEPPGDGQTASALLLEASGSLRLFGPMGAWQSRVETLCRDLGHAAVLRAAETPSAALALARAGVSRLPDVPLFHTGLAEAEVESLANMGISTLGPLLQLPQAELGQRFGAGLTNYLQRLAGAAPDPRRCIEPKPVFASSLNLLDPITDKSALLFPMQRLLTELEHWLIGRQLGAARLMWRFAPHEAAAGVSMPVRFAAARQRKAAFMEVVRLALNKAELPENVLEIGLQAKSLAPWTTRSRELFELPLQQKSVAERPSQQKQTAPTELIDRFTAHLGEAGCSGITVTGQHVPEWAWRSLQPGSARGHPSHKKTQPGSVEPSAGEREGIPLAYKEPSAGEREGIPLAYKEPSAGEREGIPLAYKEPSAGEREGIPLAYKEPSAGEREGIPLAYKQHPSHVKSRTGETGDSPDSPAGINRPLWFFDPPRRIDRQSFEILSGPERLQTGWWEATERARDYYVIRCGNGARGWAFVQPDGNWFLHGYFG